MPAPRLGFVAQTHTGAVDYEDVVAAGATEGFDFVELYMDGATERRALDPEEVETLHERHGIDLVVHLPFVDLDLGSPRPLIREASRRELEACLDEAAEMGAGKAVLHADTDATPPEFGRESVLPHALESIGELDAYADDAGVEVCVENLPGRLFTAYDFDVLTAETDTSLTLDTGHARVDGLDEAGMADALREFGDRISHVHVNDSRVPEDEHVPVGSGTIDFERAFRPIREGDWDGTLSVEVFTFDFDYVAMSRRKLEAWL